MNTYINNFNSIVAVCIKLLLHLAKLGIIFLTLNYLIPLNIINNLGYYKAEYLIKNYC